MNRQIVILVTTMVLSQAYSLHRSKRVVYLDTTSNIDVALQITIPFGIALPSVKKQGKERSASVSLEGSSLQQLFQFFQVESESCRKRLLCHLAADPQNFFPVSEIFSTELRQERLSLEKLEYLEAEERGQSSKSPSICAEEFPSCLVDAKSYFNTKALNIWKLIGRIFKLHFRH